MKTWLCPLCDYRCAYGKRGCNDPTACENGVKNVHYDYYTQNTPQSARSIGIAQISNEDSDHE